MTNITNITDMTADALNRALAEEMDLDLKAQSDGSDDYRIAALWFRDHGDPDVVCPAFREYRQSHSLPLGDILDFVWIERDGQPWQESIEEFHASWRRDPPDYCGDLQTAMSLGRTMEAMGLRDEFIIVLKDKVTAPHFSANTDLFCLAHAAPRQRAEAALLALRGRVE